MAISNTSQYEVETGGNDTNGGGFSTLNVIATDLSATGSSGNTSTPTLHSATISFVSADIGAYIFIKSGTNWVPGWYKITSISGSDAVVDAAVGHVTLYASVASTLNTAVGCATVASPTSGSWSLDYSQKGSKNTTGNNISTTDAGTNTTTVTSATASFTKALLGNHIYLSGGSGSITGSWFEVTGYTNSTTITVDRSVTAGAQTGATMNIGGAMLTILATTDRAWKTSATFIADTVVWVQNGAYSGATITTSGYLNSGGSPGSYQSRLVGYNVYRGDNPTAQSGNCPSYATTGAAANGWLNSLNGLSIWNFTFDGTGTTGASVGVTNTGAIESVINVKVSNYSSTGFSLSQGHFLEAYKNAGGGISATQCTYSYSHKNTTYGFATGNQTNISFMNCISANNTTVGFSLGYHCGAINCIAFANGSDGISASNLESTTVLNNIVAANGGWGINMGGGLTPYTRSLMVDYNAYHNNVSGTITGGVPQGVHDVVITGGGANTPFTASEATNKTEPPVSNDYTLNNSNPGGAQCRAAGIAGVQPGILSAASYRDLGPFQHQDTGGGGTTITTTQIMGG
jgi:hypothetical protein